MRKAIFLIVLLAVATAVSAQTYKWKDASGRTQYSDTPPPAGTKDVQQLRKATGAATPAAAAGSGAQQKTYAEQDAEFRKRLADKKEAEEKQAKADKDEQDRARNCEQATNQLKAHEIGQRMTRVNEKGERITLSDAEREQAKAQAQKAVDTWCK